MICYPLEYGISFLSLVSWCVYGMCCDAYASQSAGVCMYVLSLVCLLQGQRTKADASRDFSSLIKVYLILLTRMAVNSTYQNGR